MPRPVPPPRRPALLLATLLATAPHAAALGADGFTEIGVDPPERPRPAILAATGPAPDAPAQDPLADTDWAAWWREWEGWSPFALDPSEAGPGAARGQGAAARLGGGAGPATAYAEAWPGYAAIALPISPAAASHPPTGPAPDDTGGAEPIDPAATALLFLVADPAPARPPPVIGEPASMALLGGALAALGLLRRRRLPLFRR